MSSQFRGHRPATPEFAAPARPARRVSYPDISPQSRHNAGTHAAGRSEPTPWANWPAWTDQVRYTLALDPEGGTP
jgi:hypothetical protein